MPWKRTSTTRRATRQRAQKGVTDIVPRDQTRILSEQGTNYEPDEEDSGAQSGDERPSSSQARTDVTAAIPRDVGVEIQEEEPDYDDETYPVTEVRVTPDSPTEGASKSPITEAVSERDLDSVSSDFDGGGPGGADETEPPYPNEDVIERGGIDPADIEDAARGSADIGDDADTVPTRVTTYQVAEPAGRVPQDVQTRKGNRMIGFHVTPKGASIYTEGDSEGGAVQERREFRRGKQFHNGCVGNDVRPR
ncbi:hypothetical protein MTO96_049564 [Rhipicephalus appendiculatus]